MANYFTFSGSVSEHISAPISTDFNISDVEIQCKFKTTDVTIGTQVLLDLYNGVLGGYRLYLNGASSQIQYVHYVAGDAVAVLSPVGAGSLANDTWYEVVVTRDSSTGTVKFYIDGTEYAASGTQTPGALGAPNIGPFIAATDTGTVPLSGSIEYVRILDFGTQVTKLDADFSNISVAELEAKEWTSADGGHTLTIKDNEWAYVRPITSGILARAELLLQADDGNEGHSPKWADRSGNDHHAQLGSAAGTDTNDPEFLPHDGADYVRLPGVAGNYVDTADVNLLDADTAHVQQSIGRWKNAYGFQAIPALSQDIPALFGDNVLLWKIGSTGNDGVIMASCSPGTAADPCSASTEYTFRVDLAQKIGNAEPYQAYGIIYWYDAAGSSLGSDQETYTPLAVDGSFTEISITATSPVGAAFARGAVYVTGIPAHHRTVNDWIYSDRAMLVAGSDATFVPSLRIVGDTDDTIDVDLDEGWAYSGAIRTFFKMGTTPVELALGSTYATVQGQPYFQFTLDGAATTTVNGTAALSGTGRKTLQVTRDASTGDVNFYLAGVKVGDTVAGASGALVPVGAALTVLNGVQAKGYSFVRRDGIGGPIVARYDAADAEEPFATQEGATDGRTWTYNRSGSGLYVVDRPSWGLHADDYFEVADAAGLDSGAAEDITLLVVARTRDNTPAAHATLAAKGLGGGGWYMLREAVTTGLLSFLGDNGAGATRTAVATQPSTLTTYVAAGRRSAADGVSAFVDAVEGTPQAATAGDWSNALSFYVGARRNTGDTAVESFYDGEIVAVALFRESLTDDEIVEAGEALLGGAALDWILLDRRPSVRPRRFAF